ncbi:hypothetical protein DFA_07730 [Cavenderia fasciculata]|uniref:Uncharacterized protein n=1 Tax=Cavenderia fasciculata TaxID=261658 RepID=F4Q330_CACFS|nr:uncharacterized protein DFA_07730 [Cavenderia fasciculata]EGG16752.1 hypothetical protein DFA_07730 [Cavenderia fasciculata]|eukprot:XP_004355226.1 hypothetical protein DFA_07730 [Cavenderia fasciculata]
MDPNFDSVEKPARRGPTQGGHGASRYSPSVGKNPRFPNPNQTSLFSSILTS